MGFFQKIRGVFRKDDSEQEQSDKQSEEQSSDEDKDDGIKYKYKAKLLLEQFDIEKHKLLDAIQAIYDKSKDKHNVLDVLKEQFNHLSRAKTNYVDINKVSSMDDFCKLFEKRTNTNI